MTVCKINIKVFMNKITYLWLVMIRNDRARTERLTAEVRDGKRRRDIRMQSLIAPELTPTHARSAALVARLFVCFIWAAHTPNISGRPIENITKCYRYY